MDEVVPPVFACSPGAPTDAPVRARGRQRESYRLLR